MLTCVNCNKAIAEQDVKFFLNMLLCPDCERKISALYNKFRNEIENLRLSTATIVQALFSNPNFKELGNSMSSTADKLSADDLLLFLVNLYSRHRKLTDDNSR